MTPLGTMTVNVDGHDVLVELQVGPSTRVQLIDGTWETHLGVFPVIVSGGPSGPDGDGGEEIPVAA